MDAANHLSQLESRGLVRVAATHPELEYLFRHVMLQDAAYQSILKLERKRLHRLVGEILEQTHSQNLNDLSPTLARHFDEADDLARALRYYVIAGDAASRVYAIAEAVAHYTRAREISKRLPRAPEMQNLYSGFGRVLEISGRHQQAIDLYEELRETSRQHEDRQLELAALTHLATLRSAPSPVHDSEKGRVLLEQVIALTRALGDSVAECRALWNLLLLNNYSGRQSDAIKYGEQALALARQLKLNDQIAFTLNDLSFAYISASKFARAKELLEEVCPMWRTMDNRPMLSDCLSQIAMRAYFAGEFDLNWQAGEEASQISQAIHNAWGQTFSQYVASYSLIERGNLGRARDLLEQSVRAGEEVNLHVSLVIPRSELACVYGYLGAFDHGIQLAQASLTVAETHLPLWSISPISSLSRLYVMKGDVEKAEETIRDAKGCLGREYFSLPHVYVGTCLAEAELALLIKDCPRAMQVVNQVIAYIQRTGARTFLPEALYLKSQALLPASPDEVRLLLTAAQQQAELLGSRRILWKILFARGDLEKGEESKSLRRQARQIVAAMADDISQTALRASFLNRADIRQMMSKE